MFSFLLSLLLVAAIGGDSSNQLTKQEAKTVLAISGWPAELREEALEVMICESSLITDRIGDDGNSLGLFQIQWTPATWKGWKYYPDMYHLKNKNILNAIVNSQAALVIYNDYGWTPWVCRP